MNSSIEVIPTWNSLTVTLCVCVCVCVISNSLLGTVCETASYCPISHSNQRLVPLLSIVPRYELVS